MREPKPITHPIAEAVAYVIVAALALTVIANASKNPQRLGPAVYAEAGR